MIKLKLPAKGFFCPSCYNWNNFYDLYIGKVCEYCGFAQTDLLQSLVVEVSFYG